MSEENPVPPVSPHGKPVSEEQPLPALTPSRFRDRELWVGVFVILVVAAGLAALFILTDAALFRGRYIIRTVVTDAGGIRRGDPVQMRGVNIGRVTSFRVAPEGVAVDSEIDNQYPIPPIPRWSCAPAVCWEAWWRTSSPGPRPRTRAEASFSRDRSGKGSSTRSTRYRSRRVRPSFGFRASSTRRRFKTFTKGATTYES